MVERRSVKAKERKSPKACSSLRAVFCAGEVLGVSVRVRCNEFLEGRGSECEGVKSGRQVSLPDPRRPRKKRAQAENPPGLAGGDCLVGSVRVVRFEPALKAHDKV